MSLRTNSFLSNSSNHSTAASQFQTWAREKEAHRQAAAKADGERARLESEIAHLRQEQRQIGQEIHVTTDAMGRVHREREMLVKERARLEKVLALERKYTFCILGSRHQQAHYLTLEYFI
jgi:septal ring factor EnvC (AmiA/AmiB activator)